MLLILIKCFTIFHLALFSKYKIRQVISIFFNLVYSQLISRCLVVTSVDWSDGF